MDCSITSISYCPVKSLSFQSVKSCNVKKDLGMSIQMYRQEEKLIWKLEKIINQKF